MAQDFAQGMIQAFAQGQQAARNQRLNAQEIEDRDIEKKLLAHRLRELKLTDELNKRKMALENLQMVSGQRQNEIPSNMLEPLTPQQLEGDKSSGMIATMPETIQPAERNIKRMDIPGSDELGIPGVSLRPDTMEQQLADLAAKSQIQEMYKAHSVGAGGLWMGGRLVAPGRPPNPPAPQWREVSVRRPDGSVEKRIVRAEEAAAQGPYVDAPPPDNTVVPVENYDPGSGQTTVTYTPRPDVRGKTVTKRPPAGGGGVNQVATSANLALQALNELESLPEPAPSAPTGNVITRALGVNPAPPETPESMAQGESVNRAVGAYMAYLVKTGVPAAEAKMIAHASLGVPFLNSKGETVGEMWTPARRKIALVGLKKALEKARGNSPVMSHGAGVAASPGISVPSGKLIMRDGKLVLVQE